MAIEYLKTGKSEADHAKDDAKVPEATIEDFEAWRYAATRELVKKSEGYDHDNFRPSQTEVIDTLAMASTSNSENVRFALAHARRILSVMRGNSISAFGITAT
ncbi:hypothetical protein [uncultured Tateyamaria sp.]|uniref:hypothetical protein n=1 Tax=uncultured Tateyamaria sp. TaxID=455651 RepID=UPI00260B28FD|nr:hypothetical protein [uncultured Tateyamaria sp.]